jgi:hypothetical protein
METSTPIRRNAMKIGKVLILIRLISNGMVGFSYGYPDRHAETPRIG